MSFCWLQDDSSWTCEGDSGSPLVYERIPLEFYLLGILHGSKYKGCVSSTTSPGLFANLENPENLEFILKWKKLGKYFLSEYLQDLKNHSAFSIKYLDHLDTNRVKQSLWSNYTNNEDVFTILYFNTCKSSTSISEDLEIYDCSLYDSKVLEVCNNGKTILENFEIFEVDCSSKYVIYICD